MTLAPKTQSIFEGVGDYLQLQDYIIYRRIDKETNLSKQKKGMSAININMSWLVCLKTASREPGD